MSDKTKILAQVYAAETPDQQRAAYDAWSSDYETDINSYGMRLPWYAATVFAANVPRDAGPILDAGCGTGMQSEPLAVAGYGPFHGIDLSEGMMDVARRKGIYQSLKRVELGRSLDIPDNSYPVTYCIGALTPGHAPATALEGLIRVTAKGGYFVFSLRTDSEAGVAAYQDARAAHIASGRLRVLFETGPFASMPLGAPDIRHAVYVTEVLS